jgi:hypothetical protein
MVARIQAGEAAVRLDVARVRRRQGGRDATAVGRCAHSRGGP